MLIVETGTGIENANTYASLAATDAYHNDRANVAWTGAASQYREAALINATDYIEAQYLGGLTPLTTTQGLTYPLYGVSTAVNPIPAPLVRAVMLLALEALAGPLAPTQTDRATLEEEKSLDGVGSTKTTYASGKQARFPAVDALMSTIGRTRVGSNIRSIPLVRV